MLGWNNGVLVHKNTVVSDLTVKFLSKRQYVGGRNSLGVLC